MRSRACLRSQFSNDRAGAVLLPGLQVTDGKPAYNRKIAQQQHRRRRKPVRITGSSRGHGLMAKQERAGRVRLGCNPASPSICIREEYLAADEDQR
jgi:hypothetical protein